MANKNGKKKEIAVTIELTKEEAIEVTYGIDLRLGELDGLFKKCKVSGMMDAAEKVADSVAIIRNVRDRIDGAPGDAPPF